MDIIANIFMTFGFLCLILAIRNSIIFKIRQKHISEISEKTKQYIEQNKNYDNWRKYYDKFDELSYERMLFDLTKWNYVQFYGNFFNEVDNDD